MLATLRKNSNDTLIAELGQLSSETARRKFLAQHKKLIRNEIVEQLAQLVVQKVRVSTQEALHLAEAAVLIAKRLRRKEALALGLRAKANALYSSGDNRAAIEHHQQSFRLYESLGIWNEAARTLSSSIQPMILVGEYDQAFQAAERAREIFTRLNDPWRLARLEINVGNIYHRQDRFEESIAHYERAYTQLMPYKDTEGIAVVLSNMAVCLISLNDFPRALATYQGARFFCQQNNMPLLVAQADYNIAYLYYLRGEYSRAIEALYAARRACESTGDAYHFALCHLDLSDIYLELNLSDEAREMAHEGFLRFEKLGMGYEAAKTLANEATAFGQREKQCRLWSALRKRERCSCARKILFGLGSSTCTRACCSSMKAGTLKHGSSASRPLLFSINRRSPGKQYSRTCCSHGLPCKWETRRKHKRKRMNVSRG